MVLHLIHRYPGHDYEIYHHHGNDTALNMRSHLQIWLTFLKHKVLNHPLAADEYIFPAFALNGLIHAHKSIDHSLIQKYINEFALEAGILTEYSTHCFHRGGAQYRFMYASIGE